MTPAPVPTSDSGPGPAYRRSPHLLALCAAAFTLPLLFVGGSVTTYRVGLAVPDWPTTFGFNMFLYDFWNAPFGVRVEHSHRLYGAAVGLATIGLALWFLALDPRRWIKALGVIAVVAVSVQGILGGTRVTQVSTFLAAVHGCTGQAFFGLITALCVLTGRDWLSPAQPSKDPQHLRRRSVMMLGLVALQIILGAWLRHYGSIASLAAHALIGLAVLGHALALAVRVERNKQAAAALVPAGRALGILSCVQVLLGLMASYYVLPLDGIPRPVEFYEAVLRTGHQTTASLVLAASVVLALRAFRHLASQPGGVPVSSSLSSATGASKVTGSLEVVA
jgi:cytochrome c oxidase assembly protein subunit 15